MLRWSWAITVVGWVNACAWLWAVGLAGVVGISSLGGGFARAETVDKIQAELLAEKIERVETIICMTGDGQADRQILDYRRTLRDAYQTAAGRPYDTPPCSLLLKIRGGL